MSAPVKCSNGCGKLSAGKICPICKQNGVSGVSFCSDDCFRRNFKKHHLSAHQFKAPDSDDEASDEVDPSSLPADGTHNPWPNYKYTGALRPVYPNTEVPRREVPEHIVKPDHANNADGISFKERVANRMERAGKVLDKSEQEAMRVVCKLAREVLDIAAAAVRPGVTTLEIDEIVHAECMKRDSYPSPLNYHKFPRSVCTSINEVICHGIPDARPLVEGDIINLDVSLYHGGFHADLNETYTVGSVSPQSIDLISCSRECLDECIRVAKPGFQYQDFGKIIEDIATKRGFETNRTFVGHGVNSLFHCKPDVPHYANNRSAGKLIPGQCFTIEPMICVGDARDMHWKDNWTAATKDGQNSAQFEETLLVTETGIEVLTARPGWALPAEGVQGWRATYAPGAGKKKRNKKKKAKKSKAAGEGEGMDGGENDDGEEDGGEDEP